MSARKRLWPPYLSFQAAFAETLGFVKRCEEKNLPLGLPEPTLYRAYLMNGTWNMGDGQDLSRFLRFKTSNDPTMDHAKVALSRLLSVAVKAHYFMAEKATVPHEPAVFSLPDLAHPGRWRYGLAYPLDIPASRGPSQARTLVVAEWDLGLSASSRPHVPRSDEFPVVLLSDPRTWLSKRKWENLRTKADGLPWFDAATSPAKKKLLDAISAHTDRATFPYGTILETPIELREDAALVGAVWAKGIRRWFLPHGFDAGPVEAYIARLVLASDQDRMRARWWERREPARANGSSGHAGKKDLA